MLKFYLVKRGEIGSMQGAIIENIYQRTNNYQIKSNNLNKIRDKVITNLIARYLFNSLKKIAKKTDYRDFIEKNPNTCNGKAVIKGTRITPITVYNYWVSNQEKYENLDLYFEDIKKAYPALDDKKTLYALLYCIRRMSFRRFFK